MFQLVGSLLAFFAIVAALASLPVAGAVFAVATFLWVMIANPNRRTRCWLMSLAFNKLETSCPASAARHEDRPCRSLR